MNSLGLSALVVSLVVAAPCPVSAQDVDAFLTRRMPYEAFDRLKATRVMISDTAFVYTGASASVKGYPQSAPFAMAKFALRGLVQSMARELVPQGIHVAHFVIDGAIRPPGQDEWTQRPEAMLDPDAIAASYLYVLRQPRSAWTREIELRPWTEKF